MAITIASIISNFDTALGDTSNDRITVAERLQFITEATNWLSEELGNEHMIDTYTLNYLDGIHYYKTTSSITDLLVGADLRQDEDDHNMSFTRKSPRELAEEIGIGTQVESSWAVERKDGDSYLVINHNSKYTAKQISSCESLTTDGGTWAIDATNSDALNLTIDTVEFKEGSGCFNFDIDVSQTANNKATLLNSTLTSMDLSSYEDLASWTFWAYIGTVTYTSSFTLYWGSDTSNYWSATVTTDINGSTWASGWNRVKIDWANVTKTGSPNVTAIDYIQIDLNFTGSQADDTDVRIDDLRLCQPEKLYFHYVTNYVGKTTAGVDIFAFAATTDVPFFSVRYDGYKFPVAHKAAALAFNSLRLINEAQKEEGEAIKALNRYRKIFESSKTPEMKSFKVVGISFNKRRK